MDFEDLELGPIPSRKRADDRLVTEPKDGPGCHRHAKRLRRAGHLGKAARFYERSLGYQEHNYEAWLEFADTLIRARDIERADAVAQKAIEGHGQARVLYAGLACVRAHQGHLSDAFRLSDVSLDTQRDWYAVAVRGEIAMRKAGDSRSFRKDAMECFEEASRLADDPWDAYFMAGCAMYDAGWPAYAAAYFSEALHVDPAAAAAWLGMGDAFQAMKLHEQAGFYYEQAIQLQPHLERARSGRRSALQAVYGLLSIFDKASLEEKWQARYNQRHAWDTDNSFER